MIFHIIIGLFCIAGFGRLLILFKRLGNSEFDRKKTIRELIVLSVLLFVSPLILSLFVNQTL